MAQFSAADIAGKTGMPYTPKLRAVPPIPVQLDQAQRLRPRQITEMIGQEEVRLQLMTMLGSAKRRNAQPEHSLFFGPPGLGKTTLARIISDYMGSKLVETSSITLSTPKMLMLALCELDDGDVLFIDEIHRLSKKCTETLYKAMEEFRLDVPTGSGKHQRSEEVDIAHFTLAAATTEAGAIAQPLFDRFGFTAELEFYEPMQLSEILLRASDKLDEPVVLMADAALELAMRSRGTPRVALKLLKKVRDVGYTMQDPDPDTGEYDVLVIEQDMVHSALALFNIDSLGLDPTDQAVLLSLINDHGGGPVGIHNLSATTGIDQRTIREVVEPWLIRGGLLMRGQTGRVATELTFDHMYDRTHKKCPPDIRRGVRL